MNTVRTFICIKIPARIQEQFEALQKQLDPFGAGVRWTRSNGIHITLKFLGDVEVIKLDSIATAVSDAVTGIDPFSFKFHGCGAFPNFKRPRVYWIGIPEPPQQLFKLNTRIENTLEKMGFAGEDRKFSPHVTLGRVKDPRTVAEISARLQNEKAETPDCPVDFIYIMKSDLKSCGAEYSTLYEIKLGR